MIGSRAKQYALVCLILLAVLWAVWPMRPTLGDRIAGFTEECEDKGGQVAELADGSGLICVYRRKVLMRENPLPPVRRT